MNALNRKLIRDLFHLRGQVIAVALVVACGIAAFVAMRSVYYSLLRSQDAYYRQYRFAEVFANLKRAPETLATRIKGIPGVAAAETRIIANVTLDVPGVEEPARGRIISIPERQSPLLNDLHITSGRYIEAGNRDEVIVSGAFSGANDLHPGDTMTAIINGRWQKLRIAGVAISPEYVYEIGGGEMFPDSRRFGVMWMSREALGPAFNMEGAFNDVALILSPGANESEVIERLDALLEDYGALGAYGRADQTSHHFISNEIAELQVTSTFIPAVFLGVTAFLIHLTLSRLVATQRDQIAVLKAFGYSNLVIGLHYLKLAFAAALGGVALGIAVGWWFGYSITALYTEYFRFPLLRYAPGAGVVLMAVLISLAASAVGALAAVWRAISLPPAEAMRPEPPARFRAGFIGRFGLNRFFSPAVRIIVRNLARRPVKAFLTTVGISLSVSLLVTGFYLYHDAVGRVVDVMFRTVYREDVSVVFNEPRPARVRYDVAHLPGVMRVEAHRSVPARLRTRHRMRRLALTGLESGAELWRVVDADYSVHEMPPDGVALTTKLAEWLGVKPGDTLTVEVMEGARPVRQLTVAGTVDDLIGMSAYMDIRALNRLMREDGSVSGLHLMVDENALPALYATLKKTPAVRSVIVPGALLANFNNTIARTIGTSTAVLIFFACVIAFGVVYNSARIETGDISRQDFERIRNAAQTCQQQIEAAKYRAHAADSEVEVAKAALVSVERAGQSGAAATVLVRAPVSGHVLRVAEESERVVIAGAPLVELSNPSLEIVIEVLSIDAVKVKPGSSVLIEGWGGEQALEARVRLVEPSAFTKISALGVEEQRVNVIADFTDPDAPLGDGYRVEARIVIWETNEILKAPLSALFRSGQSWNVFVVENGLAKRREIEPGHRTDFEVEILNGLREGESVISHPSNLVADGVRVSADQK